MPPTWLGAFVVAALVVVISVPALKRLALSSGFFDRPAAHKVHQQPVPYLGGIAIIAGALAGWLTEPRLATATATIALAAVLLGTVGLADDRYNVEPGLRLLAQTGAATVAVIAGVRVDATGIGAVDVGLTLVWIVGITNSFNLLDNMDGLAAGVAATAAAAVFALAMLADQAGLAIMAASVVGACLGFLRYNRRPAQIFMGDSGSLFLGFVMAIFAIDLEPGVLRPLSFLVPLILLGLPILDTTTVVLARRRRGRPVTKGGRDHLSHRLVARGLSMGRAVWLLVAAQAVLGALAVATARRAVPTWLGCLGALTVIAALILATRADVYPDSPVRGFRRHGGRSGDARRGRRRAVSARLGGNRGLFHTTGRIAVAKVLSGAASAGVVIVTARQLGPEGRGVFVLLFTLTVFAVFACGLGVNISGRLELVAAEPVDSGNYVGLTGALTLLQSLVCAALALTVLPLLGVRLSLSTIAIFTALGGSVIAGYLLMEALNAYGHTVVASVVDAAASVVQILLVVGVAAFGATTVGPYLGALLSAYLFEVVLALVLLGKVGVAIRPRCHGSQWRRLLGRPSGMALQLGQMSIFKIDRYLVALFLTPAAVGVYSVAAAFPELLRIVPNAMAQPVFYQFASGSSSEQELAHARRVCLAVMVVVGAALAATSPFVVSTLFGPEYDGAVAPLCLLLVAELGLAVYYLDGAALSGQGRVRAAASAVLAGVLVGGAAYLVLIPTLGITGAAIASIAGYFTMGLAAHVRLQRRPAPRAAAVDAPAPILQDRPVQPAPVDSRH